MLKSLTFSRTCARSLCKAKSLAQGTCARACARDMRKGLAQGTFCLRKGLRMYVFSYARTYVCLSYICVCVCLRKARARLAQANLCPKQIAQASRAYNLCMRQWTYAWMYVRTHICAKRNLRTDPALMNSRKELAQGLAQEPCASKLAQALDFLTFFIRYSNINLVQVWKSDNLY